VFTYRVKLVCQVCGAPWTALAKGSDEGDALFRFISEASRSRCQACTTRGAFELKGSEPAEEDEESPQESQP
jgi:hypothetical protein